MGERLHRWTQQELADLFYDALLSDARSESMTADQLRRMAGGAARMAWAVKP